MEKEQKFCSLKVEKDERFVLVFNSIMVCLLIKLLLILVVLQQMLQYPYRSLPADVNCFAVLMSILDRHNIWKHLPTRNTLRSKIPKQDIEFWTICFCFCFSLVSFYRQYLSFPFHLCELTTSITFLFLLRLVSWFDAFSSQKCSSLCICVGWLSKVKEADCESEKVIYAGVIVLCSNKTQGLLDTHYIVQLYNYKQYNWRQLSLNAAGCYLAIISFKAH